MFPVDIAVLLEDGKPRIAGHRIRVQDVAICHESLAMNPDDIVARYPELSLADIHTALAYYFDHQDEISRGHS